MPRYYLNRDVAGKPPTECYTVYHKGQTIASDLASAKEGDIVWPSLCGDKTVCLPLDAAASVLMGLPVYPLDLKNYAKIP